MPGIKPLVEGSRAPDFELWDQDGNLVRLKDLRGKKVILYFYVRDQTPGCTREACSFRDGIERFKAKQTVVLGVSPDASDSHRRFAEKFSLPFPLLADEKAAVAKKFGVWGKKNMYGKTYYGVIRSSFIIDENGRIAKAYKRVRVNGHLEQILQDLE